MPRAKDTTGEDRQLQPRRGEAWGHLRDAPRKLVRRWIDANRWGRIALAVEAALVLIALFQIVRIAVVFSLRMGYPFELEWMEGAVVDHVRVILAGEPLYREPSVSFTPFIYTPFYYGVSAAFCRVLGLGLLAPRLVSVLATAGALMLIASFVWREFRDLTAALIACGWFVATYQLTGFWLDIARVDALALFLALAAVWLARFGRSMPATIAAGVVLFLAFFTKQSALAFLAPVVAFALARGWRRALIAAAAFIVPTTIAVVWVNHTSNGWFGYYVFDVPGQHQVLWERWRPLLVDFFFKPVAVPVLLSLLLFVVRPTRLRARYRLAAYVVFLLTATASSYSSLLHRDGFVNVLIPGYAVLALVAGLGFAWVREQVREASNPLTTLAVFAGVAWLFAFGTLINEPRQAIPTRADREAGRAMVEVLRNQPEPMLMLGTGHFAFEAGHERGTANAMALADVFKTREPEKKQRLLEAMLSSIRDKHWAVVILDPSYTLLPPEITRAVHHHYRLQGEVYPKSAKNAGWPKTGFHTRPREIWVPK